MTKRKKIIAGNWKMNGTRASVAELISGIKAGIPQNDNVQWIVFPSYPFLSQAQQELANTKISFGAQNVSDKAKGAYTGEVSVEMLKEFGCTYVLIGHSERRSLYNETDAVVAAKFIAAAESGLSPVICVGETLAEREKGDAEKVVDRQLQAILSLNKKDLLSKTIIAYEPVWAIGTGVTATPEQAQQMHAFIRQQLAKYDATIADNMLILYGGSMKPDNAKSLLAMADIDGGLIGGASLVINDFLAIGKSCIQ
jgi:triosephosphate isomerase (TIM)